VAIFSVGFFLPQTMATKTLLYTTRLRVGWKQATLATYLGITRTLLSMAEVGERDLPMPAYLRLLQLVKLLPATQETDLPHLTTTEKDLLASQLTKEIKEKTWEIARLQATANQLKERLQLMAAQRTLLEKVLNAQDLSALEGREKDFWLQQQAEVGKGQIVDAYFESLKATRALEVLGRELELLTEQANSHSIG
jgi:transcriptional regulator with XRE-family HTH domain